MLLIINESIYNSDSLELSTLIAILTGINNINGIEGFWSYVKERLVKYHGVSKKNSILYLNELEFRYNL